MCLVYGLVTKYLIDNSIDNKHISAIIGDKFVGWIAIKYHSFRLSSTVRNWAKIIKGKILFYKSPLGT